MTPLSQEVQVSKHLNKLDLQKSRRPGVIHPGVLKELAGIIVSPLAISFESHGDWGRFLRTGRK